MVAPGPPIALAELRRSLERMESHAGKSYEVLPFGLQALDQHLPRGGLTRGALHEVIEAGPASDYAGVATLFVGGIAARLPGPVLWCLRRRDLFAPALARIGLHPDRVIYCETLRDREVLPAMEEGLRCAGLAAVVGEVTGLSLTASRRLHLRAEESGVMALVLRRWWNTKEHELAGKPNAAATRWQVAPVPSPDTGFEGLPRASWQVELLRCRGGEAHSWIVEAPDAAGHLALPAALAERSPATAESRRAAAG